jgi:hypothetical protein
MAALGDGKRPKAGCVAFRGFAVGAVLFAVGAALVVLGTIAPVRAQLLLQVPAEAPGPLMREAFASAYGQALADGLGEALRDAADPACLDSKKVKSAELRQRGLDLMNKWGARMLEQSASLIDSKTYESKLAESGGRNASAELARLEGDAEVKRYREIERPIRLTSVLDTVFEQFDRYAASAGIKLAAVSPLAGGNDILLTKDPTEQSEKDLKAFVASHRSPALRQFLKLSEDAADAMTAAIGPERAEKAGPATFFHGIESDLAEICVR